MQPDTLPPAEIRKGRLLALSAFLTWGLLALYWRALHELPAYEVLCHRIAWSAAFTALLITATGRWRETLAVLSDRRTTLLLFCGSLLISINWFIYIWSVNNGYVLEASLGYYLTPLVNAGLGVLALGERLRGRQLLAIGLAAAGVLNLLVSVGHLPWVALSLAATFGTYGLLRKKVQVKPIPGLFWETLGVTPPALAWIVWSWRSGTAVAPGLDAATWALLASVGAVTAIPLLWFAGAARRMRLTTLGLFQYITPTCFFLLGITVFGEPFSPAKAVTFLLIWAGIALYSAEGLLALRNARRAGGQG